MKIVARGFTIDTGHFDAITLHRTFAVIGFRVAHHIEHDCLKLNISFVSGSEAYEAYRIILTGRNQGYGSVSLMDYDCSWPEETYRRLDDYIRHLYDYDRPIDML